MIDFASRITIPSDVLFQELSGESVLLDLNSGKYFGLNEVGTRIWSVLSEHQNITDTLSIIMDEYDVDRESLSKDLVNLLENLARNGLILIEPPKISED